jgi:hypothetical protein
MRSTIHENSYVHLFHCNDGAYDHMLCHLPQQHVWQGRTFVNPNNVCTKTLEVANTLTLTCLSPCLSCLHHH